MEKRLFNKLGFETSLLGLGCMRFPQKNGKIDLLETEKLVDACMAGGINYFDTAYVYGDGDSENAVKRTLVERYPRERFYLANKLPMWLIPEGHTPQELLETSLKRTGVTYFDQYLLHNLNQENWEICKKENLVDFILSKRRQGRFGMPASPSMIRRRFCMKFWMPPTGTLFSSRSIIMTGKRPSAQRNNMKWLRPAAFPASSWSPCAAARSLRRIPTWSLCLPLPPQRQARPHGRSGLPGAFPIRQSYSAVCPTWRR